MPEEPKVEKTGIDRLLEGKEAAQMAELALENKDSMRVSEVVDRPADTKGPEETKVEIPIPASPITAQEVAAGAPAPVEQPAVAPEPPKPPTADNYHPGVPNVTGAGSVASKVILRAPQQCGALTGIPETDN